MKFTASLTVLLISSVLSFQPAPITRHGTALCMGLFDFKPFHGAGSGSKNSEIEEQYRLQQELVSDNWFQTCPFQIKTNITIICSIPIYHSLQLDVTISTLTLFMKNIHMKMKNINMMFSLQASSMWRTSLQNLSQTKNRRKTRKISGI